jgi:hypothetical protein
MSKFTMLRGGYMPMVGISYGDATNKLTLCPPLNQVQIMKYVCGLKMRTMMKTTFNNYLWLI